MAELDDLPEDVRVALNQCDEWMPHTVMVFWGRVRAELLRLARENAELRSRCNVFVQSTARFRGEAERAESELAALKARIAESIHVNEHELGDMLDAGKFAGRRVALLDIGKEG